jgi:hypothetical protein
MNLVTALALVIGALGALATWLFLDPLSALGLQIWAAFIGWASFYHCGGGEDGLKKAILAGIWGAIMATVALVLMPVVGMGAVGAAICVGVTVAIMILGAHVPMLSVIPAAVYGYASTAAFALLKSGAEATSADITTSPLLNIAASLAIGAVFGYVSEKIAKAVSA